MSTRQRNFETNFRECCVNDDSFFDSLMDEWQEVDSAFVKEDTTLFAKAVRRSIWSERIEILGSLALLSSVIYFIIRSGHADAILFGGAIIILVLYSTYSRYKSRRAEIKYFDNNRIAFLQTIIQVTTTRKNRAILGIYLLIPALFLGSMFSEFTNKSMILSELGLDHFRLHMRWIGVSVVIIVIITLVQSVRKFNKILSNTYLLQEQCEFEDNIDKMNHSNFDSGFIDRDQV